MASLLKVLLLVVAAAVLCASALVAAGDASNGFSTQIKWIEGGFGEAKAAALREGKPILALVHKTWCAACKALKKDFAKGGPGLDSVVKASENFVMVNLEDDASEGEGAEELQPEGAAYIPRVVFFDYDGTQRPDIKSSSNPKFPYYYHSAASIADVMDAALSKLKSKATVADDL